jgi:hypothetical protein
MSLNYPINTTASIHNSGQIPEQLRKRQLVEEERPAWSGAD